jgi:hypothetical protein
MLIERERIYAEAIARNDRLMAGVTPASELSARFGQLRAAVLPGRHWRTSTQVLLASLTSLALPLFLATMVFQWVDWRRRWPSPWIHWGLGAGHGIVVQAFLVEWFAGRMSVIWHVVLGLCTLALWTARGLLLLRLRGRPV